MTENEFKKARAVVSSALTRAASFYEAARNESKRYSQYSPDTQDPERERTSVGHQILRTIYMRQSAPDTIVMQQRNDLPGLTEHFAGVVKDLQSRNPETRAIAAEGVVQFLDKVFGNKPG